MDIHSLVEERLAADTDFQATLTDLSDEDKNKAITEKKLELVKSEFETLSAQQKKDAETAKNQKIRAEKAEAARGTKIDDATDTDKKSDDLPSKDLYALIDAKVPQEDVEEVTRAAKALGKSISESLKDPIVKGILANRAEERTTAEAANTRTTTRSTHKVDGATLVKNLVDKGEVPEKGSPEADELFWARRGGKK